MKKKLLTVILVTTLASMILAGCGNTGSNVKEPATTQEATPTTEATPTEKTEEATDPVVTDIPEGSSEAVIEFMTFISSIRERWEAFNPTRYEDGGYSPQISTNICDKSSLSSADLAFEYSGATYDYLNNIYTSTADYGKTHLFFTLEENITCNGKEFNALELFDYLCETLGSPAATDFIVFPYQEWMFIWHFTDDTRMIYYYNCGVTLWLE